MEEKLLCKDVELFDVNDMDLKAEDKNLLALYMKDISKYEMLSPKEELQYITMAQSGDDDAKEIVINSNLRLVVYVAKKFKNDNLTLLDLIQEGNKGLITAVSKFDCSKGVRFSTYATHWIRQAIQKAIVNDGSAIRLPSYIHDRISKVNKAKDALIKQGIENPTVAQIAVQSDLERENVEDVLDLNTKLISLQTPVGDDDNMTLEDVIYDTNEMSLSDQISLNEAKREVNASLGVLSNVERKVITMRYGLFNHKECTLEQIGKELLISREGVRKIEKKALGKLKDKLSPFFC